MHMSGPLAQASIEERNIMAKLVRAEIARQQRGTRDYITALEEELKQKTKRLNKMFARDLEADRSQAARRTGFLRRMGERIVNAYAVAFTAVVLWGEMLGLWVREDD